MDGSSILGAVSGAGGTSLSPTSPVSGRGRSHIGANGHHQGAKRKRSLGPGIGAFDSSPGHDLHDDDDDHPERKRQPGVKRACNECRQQKLRCDVVQDPFEVCSRCRRLRLDCKIESNFKRVGKRSKHAEMEKEIEKLRRSVQRAKNQGYQPDDEDDLQSQMQSPIVNSHYNHTRNPSLMGSDEAVSSLLHLKRGGSYAMQRIVRELEDVRLTEDAETTLFTEFFTCYHPFLPFLDPRQTPEVYYTQHKLLYWSIVSVAARRYTYDVSLLANLTHPLSRLLWQTIGDVPSTHYVVKALAILCSWPLPTSLTSADPTHIICGIMMKTATGIGLHRPNHINDFTRVPIELDTDQLRDRIVTWAVANIVAQNVATGYGQPASSLYDWTLAIRPGDMKNSPFRLSEELEARLKIERFCDKVSKEMYSNASDSRGVAGDDHRSMLMRVFRRDYTELQADIMSRNVSPFVHFHLRAANLHMRLAGFFDSSATPGYMDDLMGLWRATTTFLDTILENEMVSSPQSPDPSNPLPIETLKYATNYLRQMLVAAGFALLKLMRSFFKHTVDHNRGRELFHRTIRAIRTTVVMDNDLQWRTAELMVQIWNDASLDQTKAPADPDAPIDVDDSLQLKVRCRHSMSLVFDLIWHWRIEFQSKGRGTLDPLKQQTNIESANDSSASSTHLDSTLLPAQQLQGFIGAANGALTPSGSNAIGQQPSLLSGINYDSNPSHYDFFDPQHWMLDSLLDFNYNNYAAPLEST